jgi:HTH-type transcriptional repressor of NAD biosynthesis genes
VIFDQPRKNFPVSGSLIRESPFKYWDFIPKEVQPYFVKRICFYGPESTGKSTAAVRMAERYNTVSVPEVAREMITSNDFTLDDIIRIGKAQTERVLEYTKIANKLLFCDTDVIVTQIYSRHYLGVVPDILYELEKEVKYDQYFFFDIDVPWVEDGLRDLPHRRESMRKIFLDELDARQIKPIMVSGSFEQRDQIITTVLDGLLAH